MLFLTGQTIVDDYKNEKMEVALISGEVLSEPKTRVQTGKKSGKQFSITSVWVKYDGDPTADYTITLECWGAAGRDAQKAHKRDGIICYGLVFPHEYNGKRELRAKVGIGRMAYEPIAVIKRGGIADMTPQAEDQRNMFTDIQQDQLPF